jgi:hypothetical protein
VTFSTNDDIFNNNGMKKTVIQPSQIKNKMFPELNDMVEIMFKIFRSDGSLAYNSHNRDLSEERLDNTSIRYDDIVFDFKIGQSPSEAIPGWELAIKTMLVDEIASFYIPSKYAFGDKGTMSSTINAIPCLNNFHRYPLIDFYCNIFNLQFAGLPSPISIKPHEDIVTEIQLLRIIPALSKRYETVGTLYFIVTSPLHNYTSIARLAHTHSHSFEYKVSTKVLETN